MTKLPELSRKLIVSIIGAGTTILLLFLFTTNSSQIQNIFRTLADDVNLQLNIINSPPEFAVPPIEQPASSTTTPTNTGSNVTFVTTATDLDQEQYTLIVCSEPGVLLKGGPPICQSTTTYCVSDPTDSGVEASCSFTTHSIDPEINDWYAAVCDQEACVLYEPELSLDEDSPFIINHEPSFTANGATSNANPGGTITFTSTASDSDSAGSADTVKLLICTTNSATSAGCTGGAGNTLCTSSLTSSNPTCNYNLPSVIRDTTVTYYAFVFDNHGLGASSSRSGSFIINNMTPSITNMTTNIGGSNLSLTENSITNVVFSGTITDTNSCQDIDSYKSFAFLIPEYPVCEDQTPGNYDAEQCVPSTIVTCQVAAGNTCTGPTDPSFDFECTIPFPYYAEATVVGSRYPDGVWWVGAKAYDGGGSQATNNVGVYINMLAALNVTSTINFGSLNAGQNTGAVNQSTTVTATGNVGLDVEVSGTNMTNGGNTIPVGNQRYSTNTFTYPSGNTLSTTPTNVEINIAKPAFNFSPTGTLYWGLAAPSIAASGNYTGTNSITGVLGEILEW